MAARQRARPMSPEERRLAIIEAVLPLLRERGRDVSSRELADAAGVAEGTVFRAFGDKESLISAAVEHYFDPEPFRNRLRGIDPDEPTADKIAQVLKLLRERFTGGIGLMSALRIEGRPPPRHEHDEGAWLHILPQVFRPEELSVPVETLGYYLRLIAFGSSVPVFNEAKRFDDDELIDLVLHGTLATDRKN